MSSLNIFKSLRKKKTNSQFLVENEVALEFQKEENTRLLQATEVDDLETVKKCLQDGASPNACCVGTETYALHLAVKNGNASMAKLLLQHGALVDPGDEVQLTPLHLAANCGFEECLETLLQKGADPNRTTVSDVISVDEVNRSSKNEWQDSPSHEHYKENLSSQLTFLYQATPLHFAAWQGHLQCVLLLLANGALVNKADRKGRTPLHLSSFRGRIRCVKALLQAEADVTLEDENGFSSLHSANDPKCIAALVEAGAKVNAVDSSGDSPLHLASRRLEPRAVAALLAAAADVSLENLEGKKPLHVIGSEFTGVFEPSVANVKSFDETFSLLVGSDDSARKILRFGYSELLLTAVVFGSVSTVRTLMDYVQEPMMWCENDGSTVLHEAVRNPNPAIMIELLSDDRFLLPLEYRDYKGRTPLLLAVQRRKTDYAAALLRAGAEITVCNPGYDVNSLFLAVDSDKTKELLDLILDDGRSCVMFNWRDGEGRTPLLLAAELGWSDAVARLMAAGANPCVHNIKTGQTVLHVAADKSNLSLLQILLRYCVKTKSGLLLTKDVEGRTVLHLAVLRKKPDCVQMIIELTQDIDGNMEAEVVQNRETICEDNSGADKLLDVRDGMGRTPLHLAVELGVREIVLILLEAGCDMTPRVYYGMTVFHLAVWHVSADVLTALLRDGRCQHLISSKDRKGNTPLDVAMRKGRMNCARILHELRWKTSVDDAQLTALHRWASEGNAKELSLLLKDKFFRKKVNARDARGRTPLHLATEGGHNHCVGLLMKAGALLCLTDWEDGMTVLHVAALNKHHFIISLFVNGDQLSLRELATEDWHGNTALAIAVQEESEDCVRLLLDERLCKFLTVKMIRKCIYLAVKRRNPVILQELLICLKGPGELITFDNERKSPLETAFHEKWSQGVTIMTEFMSKPVETDL